MQPWHMDCPMHACMYGCMFQVYTCKHACVSACMPAGLSACIFGRLLQPPPPNPALFNMLTAAYGGQSVLHCWPPEPLPPGETPTAAPVGCVPTGALQGPPHWLEHCLKRSHGALAGIPAWYRSKWHQHNCSPEQPLLSPLLPHCKQYGVQKASSGHAGSINHTALGI
jgi:hypothetical protein